MTDNEMIMITFFRIGVNGLEDSSPDPRDREYKKLIGTGCKLKMDGRYGETKCGFLAILPYSS